MADHAVDATLAGDSTQVADAVMLYAGGAVAVTGAADLVAPNLLWELGTTPLVGDASVASDFILSLAIDSSFGGGADVTAPNLLACMDATLTGGADLTASFTILLSAALLADGSGLTVGDLLAIYGVSAALEGVADFPQVELTLMAHPGTVATKPIANSGATLQQFIDATGSSKASQKTQPVSHPVVDPNPPKKPFAPR